MKPFGSVFKSLSDKSRAFMQRIKPAAKNGGDENSELGDAPPVARSAFAEKLRQFFSRAGASTKAQLERWQVRDKIERLLPQDLARSMPRTWDAYAISDWFSQAFQKEAVGFYGRAVTIVFVSYFMADLSSLLLEQVIPDPPPPRSARVGDGAYRSSMKTLDQYEIIMSRNLFKSIDPDQTGETEQTDENAPAQRTTLPFQLVGTVILRNELKSIGTIEDRTAQLVYPVRIEDEIPSKARILKVEARRVTFKNLTNGRKEFVELPEETGTNARISIDSSIKPAQTGVERVSETQFQVSRSTVDKALENLSQVLTQARAVPNVENGVPSGYKLFQIVPGSIYDLLGLKNGDVIAGLNGQAINDPAKAFELLNELRTTKNLDLQIKRNGKSLNNSYDIR